MLPYQFHSIGKAVSEPMKLLQGLGKDYEAFSTAIQRSMKSSSKYLLNSDVVSQRELRHQTYETSVAHLLAFNTQRMGYGQIGGRREWSWYARWQIW